MNQASSFSERFQQVPFAGLLLRAWLHARRDNIKDMSASIAFFSFFALFPLILAVIALGSFFVDAAELAAWLDDILTDSFPVSGEFVTENVDTLFRLRGAAGVIGIAGLIWSASKMAGALNRGINKSLGMKRGYAFYWSPLRNFGMTLTIPILLLLTFSFTTIIEIIDQFDFGFVSDDSWFHSAGNRFTSLVISTCVLTLIYKLVPYHRPALSQVLPAAVTAAVLLEIGKTAFVIYVNYSDRFEVVYGPVSSIIVLLLWLYVSAGIVLYGREIVSLLRPEKVEESE